jgi:hypothetical protein
MQELRHSILGIDPGEFIFWVVLLIVIALLCFYLVFRFWKRARLMEDVPTSKIRSAAQGYVELIGYGQLMGGEPIIAPLSRTPCTWYQFRIEEKQTRWESNRRHSKWQVVESGTSDNLFLLVDETGKCIIDPDGAEVTPSESESWYGSSRYPEYGVKASSSFMGSGQYRYSEKRMHPGDHLYAIGHFKTVTGERGSLNDDVKAILRQWKEFPDDYLRHFDTDQNGEIDLQEWQEVRRAAEKQALKERQERIREHGTLHILKKDDHRPYLLSTVPEFDLVKRLRIFASLSLAGFIAFGSLSVWLILVRLSA